jgi:hypothetical protein
MRCDRNHNGLWIGSWELRENYGALIAALFQGFSQENGGVETVAEIFQKSTGCKLPDVAIEIAWYYQPLVVRRCRGR